MAELGWGVIGASTIAREWMIGAIRSQPGNGVLSVMSTDPARGAAFAAANGIEHSCTSLDELLADDRIGAVYISTTNELHAAQTIAAARAGKHVLCDKPLATTLADAKEMVLACERAGVAFGTNHHLRHAATHREIARIVRSGDIGTPVAARVFHAVRLPDHLRGWRLDRPEAGAGVVLDITVHDADTLRFILGSEPIEATALTKGPCAIEHSSMAVLRFDDGVLAQLHDDFEVPHAGTGIEIHGSDGSVIGRDVMTPRPVGRVWRRDATGEHEVAIEHHDLYVDVVADFLAAVDEGRSPSASGYDGMRSLATALAVLESARTGRTVAVER